MNRCASTHFGENQLAPSSTGISPLTTTHPPIFQHRSVRTFTWCYPSFILVMVRSPGFGSRKSDLLTPYSDLLSLWLRIKLLNLATSSKSPAHSSTGTRSDFKNPPTVCQRRVSCSVSLPYRGSFHLSLTVLFHYRSPRSI